MLKSWGNQKWLRWKKTCDPDESSEWPTGWALPRGSVQPDPEAKSQPAALHLDARQQLVNHACHLASVHCCQGPASFPAAPSGLSEGSLLEEDSVTSVRVADCIFLRELNFGLLSVCLPQPLALVLISQADQQPQHPQETHAAAAAAPDGLLHPPPIHLD